MGLLAWMVSLSPAFAAPLSCPSGQACGDHCIAWTEVCAAGLVESLGYPPPSVTAAGEAAGPPGSTLLTLPELVGPVGPGVRAGAPPWCTTGLGPNTPPPIECLAWYQPGHPEGTAPATGPAPASCPQHEKCGGACLAPGETCAAAPPSGTGRLDAFDAPQTPPVP